MGKLFEELKVLKKAYDDKLRKEGEAAVKDAFKDIFERFPELEMIWWTQYTPYFNDGDTCVFGVHDFYCVFPDPANPEWEVDYSDYDNDTWSLKSSKDPRKKEIGKAVEELKNELPKDVMLSVFDDHVKVVATRK
jgi:hypothetical protein